MHAKILHLTQRVKMIKTPTGINTKLQLLNSRENKVLKLCHKIKSVYVLL